MGIWKKHKGKAVQYQCHIHVHTLSPWPARGGGLWVTFSRGSHSGAVGPAAPAAPQGDHVTYVFEQQMQLPATLYQEAAKKKTGAKVSFESKPLQLMIVSADSRGKPASGPPLGTVTLDLADYAAAGGRTQQAWTVAGTGLATSTGAPKLLLTIGCLEASQSRGEPLAVEPSTFSVQEDEGIPLSLSTDDEGSSRPSSQAGSRPTSRQAGLRTNSMLPALHEEPAAAVNPASLPTSPANGEQLRNSLEAAAAAIVGQGLQHEAPAQLSSKPAGARYDDDGFLIDDEASGLVAEDASLEESSSVRRNLGSALEHAEASEAASSVHAGDAGVLSEVQSQAAAGAAMGGFALARYESSRRAALATPAGAAAELPASEADSPEPASTGQQSSLSAGADPAAPFSMPPSTARRFAQRGEEAGAHAAGRRWAWKRDGGAPTTGPGVSVFQRARVASASKQEALPGGGVPGESTLQSASGSLEPPSRRTTTGEQPAAGAAGAAAQPAAMQPQSSSEAGLGAHRPSMDAVRHSSLAMQRSVVGASGLLRPTLSLLDSVGLPSPNDLMASSAVSSMVVEALLRELRCLAALESAVYLAGGRRAFSGGASRQLHAPARRLARTVISLGPLEGPAFAQQAIQAVRACAGAASGDVHRLTFWWSNILQLRAQLSALCHGPANAASADGHGAGPSAGAQLPAARADGLDWMQAVLPQLRELEAWLFGEAVKHLWWRVLLRAVAQDPRQPPSGAANPAASPFSTSAAPAAAGGGSAAANGVSRSAKSAPHLGPVASGGGEAGTPASMQGTPRSFETPEEEALQRWVDGLSEVERAMRDASRPGPAPRPHLALLHRQLIIALLRRLDTLLFRKLLLEDGDDRLLRRLPGSSARDAFARSAEADEVLGAGTEAAAAGLLDPALLPFSGGAVTFTLGVDLKMAVSRLNHWAADCGVREERLPAAGRSTEMSDYRLFPCLRATADLLMMPKEVLTDSQMRREVVPGLPLHRVVQLLERWKPDEAAPDPLPPGLLEALRSESPRSDGGSTPSPTARPDEEYQPPSEAALLLDGIIEPMSLEMDADSDDELETLAGLHSSAASHPGLAPPLSPAEELRAQRFALLKDLWLSSP